MTSSTVKVAVVGCGYWGPNLIRNFNDLDACELHTVCDMKQDKLVSVARKYPQVRTSKEYNDILNDPSIDAVAISTPVSTHFRLAKEAFLHDKHVFIEKPIARSSGEAEELIELAAKKQKVLMVGHTFLYSPPVLKVKELIDNATIGTIYYIDSSRVNLGLFQPDVSVIWDLGPHDTSIILHWLDDEPVEVNAIGGSYIQRSIEEVAFMTLRFKSGVVAHLHLSWLAPCKLRRTSIVGSKRMVIYDDTESVEKVKIYDQGVVKNPEDFGEFQLTYRSGDVISPHLSTTEPLKLECSDFVASIIKGTSPKSDGLFGLRVVKVLEAAQRSIEQKGAAVKII